MLSRLYVKNFALINEADIEFDGKLNVLSGETGSGKSVILDSINFVLGSKADKSQIRYGEEEAVVKAEFTVNCGDVVKDILREMDIETDGVVVISRRFSSGGKGAIKVNGNAVTSAMLKKIASHLVDVHGQSEHFFLLSEANQLSVIDKLCGEPLERLKAELNSCLSLKKEYKAKISALGGSESERAQRLDLLSYQIDEIEKSFVKPGEIEELKSKKKIYDNVERLVESLGAMKAAMAEDNGCLDMLSYVKKQAAWISEVGEEYEGLYGDIENLCDGAADISDKISDLLGGVSIDEDEARFVEERLDLYRSLTKKYGATEEDILAYLDGARKSFDELSDSAAELERINEKILQNDKKILETCQRLTEQRKAACETFCKNVVEQLKSLNIPNASFCVDFAPYDSADDAVYGIGADKVCFMFSANKGEPKKPLSKVISGGEMSRFMLAAKTQFKGVNGISTYIFDEIDAGISGITARSVAEKLVAISRDTQVIAVSHQPQVCAAADSEYLIYKTEEGGKTYTNVKKLTKAERIEEIVRLTGSINSVAAKKHAEELLSQYQN